MGEADRATRTDILGPPNVFVSMVKSCGDLHLIKALQHHQPANLIKRAVQLPHEHEQYEVKQQ
jgi:hypothetical protein